VVPSIVIGDCTAVRKVGEVSKGETGSALFACKGESVGVLILPVLVVIGDCGTTISTWRGVRRGGMGKLLVGSKRSDDVIWSGSDVALWGRIGLELSRLVDKFWCGAVQVAGRKMGTRFCREGESSESVFSTVESSKCCFGLVFS